MSPVVLLLIASLALAFVAVEAKSSRPDATLLKIPSYRRILGVIMPTRNESFVLFDDAIDAEALEAYIAEAGPRFGAHATHCVIAATAIGLAENPSMNRFMNGGRLYQRKGRWITFSMKRQKQNKKAKLAAVKMEIEPGLTFRQFCEQVNGQIGVQRSGKRTRDDHEFDLLSALPGWVLRRALTVLQWANRHNLLPGAYIATDAMFTSVFVANLGSLQMGAGYHHLYEWGTCPLFLMVGQVEERAVVRDGQVVVRRILPVRFSYDERIDDGLTARFGIDAVRRVLEDPFGELGCLADDGSDSRTLDAHLQEDA